MFSVGRSVRLVYQNDDGDRVPIIVTSEDGIWSVSFERDTLLSVRGEALLEVLSWFAESGPSFVESLPPVQTHSAEPVVARSSARALDRSGYVYLLHSNGAYKIGLTKKVDRRVSEISPIMPFPVEVIHYIQTEDSLALEASLHERFASKRLNGEWFGLDVSDVAYIKSL